MAPKSNITLGILLVFDAGWIGGNNYVVSLVNSFNYLPQNGQPAVIIYYTPANKGYLKQLDYTGIVQMIETDYYAGKSKSYLLSVVTGYNQFLKKLPGIENTDAIFPIMDTPAGKGSYKGKLIGWLPDFQHREKPENFSRAGRILREFKFTRVMRYCDSVVLSSHNAHGQFKKYYPRFSGKTKISVMQFVSLAPEPTAQQLGAAMVKYSTSIPFFLLSNQFYVHKNHKIVFDALSILNRKKINARVICTGKTEDQRKPGFFQLQMEYAKALQVENNIEVLGMIDRMEQLSLMKLSMAIIQPSSYEGWNTSVEDAKKLNIPVIASDIEVHEEQLPGSTLLFHKNDAEKLAAIMEGFINNQYGPQQALDYNQLIHTFAQHFIASIHL